MDPTSLDQPYRGGFVGTRHHFALTVYFEDTDNRWDRLLCQAMVERL